MGFVQHITKGVGGEVHIDLLERPSAVTITAEQDNGTDIVTDQTATVHPVNTTLNGAVSKDATQITVASGASISQGQKLWIQDDPEDILVRRVDGTTIYLKRPLLKDHVDGATVEGARVTYDIAAADADVLFFDGRCEWTIDSREKKYTTLECTLYPLDRMASAQDIFDVNPKLADAMDNEEEIARGLDVAHDYILGCIAAKDRVRVFTGSETFVRATAFAWWMLHYLPLRGEANREMYERYKGEMDAELKKVTTYTPRDANQNGIISESDKMSFSSVRVARR